MVFTTSTESTQIFRRVIEPESGSFPYDPARFVLDLDFRGDDHERYQSLPTNAQDGTLADEESCVLDAYLHVDILLAIMGRNARCLKLMARTDKSIDQAIRSRAGDRCGYCLLPLFMNHQEEIAIRQALGENQWFSPEPPS